ncbi:hypothetical protein HYU14_07210 [Candidatus Woesearchaeota archaeon]|nr:hypothetical protein [Candidatus Woesearchaeota archaeon]
MEEKMISAKLMRALELRGFALEFPLYDANEEMIIEILREGNERLFLALPLLFQQEFDYEGIIRKLGKKSIAALNRHILISCRIFERENINSAHLKTIIKQQSLHKKIASKAISYYQKSFQESVSNRSRKEEASMVEQIRVRGILNLNQALANIYSPGKLRIMAKIFGHEPLTDTELKYYYRSIRPLILAILNEGMQKYLRIIESTKKYSLPKIA